MRGSGPALGEVLDESSRPAAGVRLRLLGGFDLSIDGLTTPISRPAQRVIAFLALHPRAARRAYLAETLWPEADPERAGGNLRSALWTARRPGSPIVVETSGHLRLAEHVAVDLTESQTQAHGLIEGSSSLGGGELSVTPFAANLLPDWTEDWVILERERFCELRLHALEALCVCLVDAGRCAEAVEAGLIAVTDDPLRESAHQVLIRAHLAEGNREHALRRYQHLRALLLEELGVEPSPETRQLVAGLSGS